MTSHPDTDFQHFRGSGEEWWRPCTPDIILVSLKAGGVGINLTAASRVYMLDPWWNPAVEEQVRNPSTPTQHPIKFEPKLYENILSTTGWQL